MRIAICDDNVEYIAIIEGYLKQQNTEALEYDTFMSGEELITAYENGQVSYDAIFLDMEMGQLDGIDTANCIRKKDDKVIIVFVTSHSKYMQRSFECAPFRFLVKPISFDDFDKVYKEICIKLANNTETFIFLENKKRTRIYCADIVFFESSSHWILVHTKDGNVHKTRKTMGELLESLKGSTFVRVHRAFVVNLNHIYQVGESEILMHHYNKDIPLSKTYKSELKDKFLNFKERKYLL